MHKAAKDKHFIKQPWFEGGPKALKKFIGEHLRYPKEALENKTEGTVLVKYDIDYQGDVVDAKVVAGLGHGCDEEAVRLVKMLKFKVEKTRGLRVLFHKNIQIHFRLPSLAKQPLEVHYNYVAAPQLKEKPGVPGPAEKQDSGYTIQIDF